MRALHGLCLRRQPFPGRSATLACELVGSGVVRAPLCGRTCTLAELISQAGFGRPCARLQCKGNERSTPPSVAPQQI